MTHMHPHQKARRICIYLGESDRWRGKPLYAALLETLKAQGIAGATVFRGVAGFGAHSHLRSTAIEVLAQDLPLLIEVVDTLEQTTRALEAIYPMVREGLITLEEVEIIQYTHRFLNPLPADRLVKEVMTRSVVSLMPDVTIAAAWKRMLQTSVKAMPVVDDLGQVVGIVTDEDLIERAGIRQRLSIAVRMDAAELNQEFQALEGSPLRLADVMTQPVVTAREDESLGSVTGRILKAGLKRLPVVNENGKLVGIISRLDILRQVASSPQFVPPTQLIAKALRVVGDIMTSEIPMVNQDDDLVTIVEKFSQSGSHRLIVVDAQDRAIGLLSDSDVVARIQPARRRSVLDAFRDRSKPLAGKETAFDLMSAGPFTAPPDLALVEAVQKMLKDGRKWLVVIDQQGKPLGLVDRQMLLQSVTSYYRGD